MPSRIYHCCGAVNRGAGMLGNTLYWGTLDAKLLAVDAKTGLKQWETTVVEDYERGYSLTVAPLIVNDKVIVGTAGGEFGIRGFLAAYDAKTGEEVWKFHTIPGPGEPRARNLGKRRLEDRRRFDLADGFVRPGLEFDVLGSGQPLAGLEPRRASGR